MGPTSTLTRIFNETLPENSLAALRHAIDLGADGVEFDVLLTADKQLAVIHDEELNKKIYGADRSASDLGLVSQYTLNELQQLNIGNGHKTPSLTDVLDLIVEKNKSYHARTGSNLMVNIELKGEDTANPVYQEISRYIAAGKLPLDSFVINSFKWETLREIKAYEPELKIMPAIRTTDLFGKENVVMPGFKVEPNTPYSKEGLDKLSKFHEEVGCFAFDCIIFDLRPEFVDFCEEKGIGLFTSTSREIVDAEKVRGPLTIMMDAGERLPVACFRADNVRDTRRVVSELDEQSSLLKAHIIQERILDAPHQAVHELRMV
ncbi:MAG: hypothetical protein DI586_00120 [Micavibrio aeruginosavorus]|uniref:GP-PDE domain-containing protein n=1 Tax=Micavibrio aeruginosavorus TaxID=349221 RepID=A0A2W5FNE1_9BACT|nr:MAG: hypothetical protein DI586_00120 [Micavibrio aeruginosavorus]